MRLTGRLAGIVLAAALVAPLAQAEVVDRVLATVDKEVILLSDVMRELAPMGEMDDAMLEERVRATLQQAIDNKILYREAVLAGMDVDDSAIDRRVQELKQGFPSQEVFLRELEAQGGTLTELREHIREQLLAHSVARQQRDRFEKQVSVSESEIAGFYQDNQDEFTHPERLRVRQIFLPSAPGTPQRREAIVRLRALRGDIEAGASFEELAREVSQAPGAQEGGIIGWVARGDLVAPLEDAVFALQPGEVSGVVESANGVHLLRVDERQEAGSASFEEVRTDIEPVIRARKRDALFGQWMDDLRERSRVRVFLR